MKEIKINVNGKEATSCIIEMGSFNLVLIKTEKGMIGCGAFDVMLLDKFNYPAVKIRSKDGSPINNDNDLLNGFSGEVNDSAKVFGIKENMSGKDILERL